MTPHIAQKGNWFIGDTDTKIYAGKKVDVIFDISENEIKSFDSMMFINEALVSSIKALYSYVISADYASGDVIVKSSELGDEKVKILFNSALPKIPFFDFILYTKSLNKSSKRNTKNPLGGEVAEANPATVTYDNNDVVEYKLTHNNGLTSDVIFDIDKKSLQFTMLLVLMLI